MVSINNYLIVSALGTNRPEIISELSRAFLQCGCNLLTIKTHIFGQDLSVMVYLAGNWGAIAKIEATLPSLEQRLNVVLHARRTSGPELDGKFISYTAQITAIDKPGILNGLSDFLSGFLVRIEEVSGQTYISQSATLMASINVRIQVPETVHLATFREQFMSYCDDQNLDAFLEAARNL